MTRPTWISVCSLLLAPLSTAAAVGPVQAPAPCLEQGEHPGLPSGVSPSEWASIRDSISGHRHAFEATPGGFEASNPRFDWRAQFDGTSALIRPANSDWSFGLALKAFGFDGQLQVVESPTFGACAEEQRITYRWTGGL